MNPTGIVPRKVQFSIMHRKEKGFGETESTISIKQRIDLTGEKKERTSYNAIHS
jgi:hypothetical protein